MYKELVFDKKKGEIINKNNKLILKHNQPCSGFFSSCTILLRLIIQFFNTQKCLPDEINCTNSFKWYTYNTSIDDLYKVLFNINIDVNIEYKKPITISSQLVEDQFSNYNLLNYSEISLFIDKYFMPSKMIKDIIDKLEKKYNINYNNLCVLFYRGNDKCKEIDVGNYDFYDKEIQEIKNNNKEQLDFLIQSDETEFLNKFSNDLVNSYIFWDEIRHINSQLSTVDKIKYENDNFYYISYFLAITIIMSKAKYIICNTGNCSLWILLFRKNSNGLQQYIPKNNKYTL
tara:strand:- start:1319 stop:2179 length:861 start_codon:yes stop_codon:yes gene_type:complete